MHGSLLSGFRQKCSGQLMGVSQVFKPSICRIPYNAHYSPLYKRFVCPVFYPNINRYQLKMLQKEEYFLTYSYGVTDTNLYLKTFNSKGTSERDLCEFLKVVE